MSTWPPAAAPDITAARGAYLGGKLAAEKFRIRHHRVVPLATSAVWEARRCPPSPGAPSGREPVAIPIFTRMPAGEVRLRSRYFNIPRMDIKSMYHAAFRAGDDDNTVVKKGANIPVLTFPAGHASPRQVM